MAYGHTPQWLLWIVFGLAFIGLVALIDKSPLRDFFHPGVGCPASMTDSECRSFLDIDRSH